MIDFNRGIMRILLSARQDPTMRSWTISAAVGIFALSFFLVYLTQYAHFFGLSFLSIVSMAWLGGWRLGLAIGAAIPLLTIPLGIFMGVSPAVIAVDVGAFIFMAVLAGGAVGLLSTLFGHLFSTQRELRLLYEILPICSHCHRIKREDQEWIRLETFFDHHVGTRFSHGICPSCLQEHYKEHDPGRN